MAVLVLLQLLLISRLFGGSDGNWCVCKSDVSTTAQQTALDYACGNGADCTPIQQNGACYAQNTVVSHCSYAVNSYFQRKNQVDGSCNFSGTAMITTTDPSYSGCSYPGNVSAAGTGNTPTATAGAPTSTLTPTPYAGVLGSGPMTTTSIPSPYGSGTEVPVDLLSLSTVVLSGLVLLRGWR